MTKRIIEHSKNRGHRCFEEAIKGFKAEKCLEIEYNDSKRLVELHAICVNEHGQSMMFVWQVSGGSRSGQSEGWKYIPLEGVTSLRISQQPSDAPRPEYQPLTMPPSSLCWIHLMVP